MEMKELRKAIERYKEAREAIYNFIEIYGDEIPSQILATLGNHHYYITSQIAELKDVIVELADPPTKFDKS